MVQTFCIHGPDFILCRKPPIIISHCGFILWLFILNEILLRQRVTGEKWRFVLYLAYRSGKGRKRCWVVGVPLFFFFFLFLLLQGFQLADSGGLIKLLETSRVRGADVRKGVDVHVHRDRDVATPFGRVGSSKGRDACCCSRRVAGGESETAGVV